MEGQGAPDTAMQRTAADLLSALVATPNGAAAISNVGGLCDLLEQMLKDPNSDTRHAGLHASGKLLSTARGAMLVMQEHPNGSGTFQAALPAVTPNRDPDPHPEPD